MKLRALFLLLLFPAAAFCQRTEMDIYKGLMYSPEDMQHLRKTADSLNLKYLQCNSTPEYHSLPQAGASYVEFRIMEKKDVPEIEALFKQGFPFEEIREKFPAIVMKDSGDAQIVFQNYYNSYQEKYQPMFFAGGANGFSHVIPSDSNWHNKAAGDWLFSIGTVYGKNVEYSVARAWRLKESLRSVQLPEAYGKLIQYVDCMVDTNTVLMLRNTLDPKRGLRNKGIGKLHEYVNMKTGWPEPPSAEGFTYLQREDVNYALENYAGDSIVRKWVRLAVEEALEYGNGGDYLEQIAAAVYSKDTALLLKRSRPVTGRCSMDESPRYHARDIAILASQTHQWPVFIKAHLNIMNDRFDRVSDGSYAQAGRKTYLRELEALDLPTLDLLLGTVLTAQNMAPQHYQGDVSRIGRALSETKHADKFENTIKKMIKDEGLDVFNRCLLFMVYTNYCYNQSSFTGMRYRIAELKRESKQYPAFIQSAIQKLHYREETSFN